MNDTIYVIGPKSIFDQRFSDFEKGIGFYRNAGFKNQGTVRHSIDGQWTLLEESESKFQLSDLNLPFVTKYTHQEIKEFIAINKINWTIEDDF